MNDKSEGIVLKQRDFKDNDYLLTIITPDHGSIRLIARGAKKNNSKNSYACSPLTLADFIFDLKEASLSLLKNVTVVNTYKNIRNDLEKIAIANLMVDIINDITKETDGDPLITQIIYDLLKGSLLYLNDHNHHNIVLGVFISNVLDVMGISPQVDGCCNCMSPKVVSISLSSGGFVCQNCGGDQPKYDIDHLRKFRLLNKAKPENLKILEDYEPFAFSLVEILYRFLEEYGDMRLASWKFLNEIMIKN